MNSGPHLSDPSKLTSSYKDKKKDGSEDSGSRMTDEDFHLDEEEDQQNDDKDDGSSPIKSNQHNRSPNNSRTRNRNSFKTNSDGGGLVENLTMNNNGKSKVIKNKPKRQLTW